MQHYITRRILLAVATLIGVSRLIFFIMWSILGDVAIAMLGESANPDTVAALRQHMGLNDPWYGQYGRWIGNRVSGSIETKTSGKSTMASMAKASLTLVRNEIDCIRSTSSRRVTKPRSGTMRLLMRAGQVLICKH